MEEGKNTFEVLIRGTKNGMLIIPESYCVHDNAFCFMDFCWMFYTLFVVYTYIFLFRQTVNYFGQFGIDKANINELSKQKGLVETLNLLNSTAIWFQQRQH